MQLPSPWMPLLGEELAKTYFHDLTQFLGAECAQHQVFPPEDQVFTALELTPPEKVRVVILGQDPYHDAGQAHGLAFSVQPGVKVPASLRNIFKELCSDMGCSAPAHGCLAGWAKQGVLLLNTVLTVRAHEAHSHCGKGWEKFTDAVVAALNQRTEPLVFVLWGKPAQARRALVDTSRHVIIEAPHPSPLSAHAGFFGSKPFSKVNQALRGWRKPEIDWALGDP